MANLSSPSKEVGSWKYAVGATVTVRGEKCKVVKQAFLGAQEEPVFFCEGETVKGWFTLTAIED